METSQWCRKYWGKFIHKKNNFQNYDFNEILEVKKIYPHGYHKTDKSGRPIYIEILSKVNITELFKISSEDRLMRYYIKEYERTMIYRFPGCTQKSNKIIEQSLCILDMEGIGLSILTGKVKEFMRIASDLAQNYYPETLGKMFLLNTSFFFFSCMDFSKRIYRWKNKKNNGIWINKT